MDIDVKNIDKTDKNTWSTTSETIYVPHFGEVELFPKAFIYQCKNHPNETKNIPS